ncbi:MAG: AAA family ATPase [Nitrospirae bacterium]|nr:AAA family ATPase [Nitrospirota bacterium]
MDFLNFFGLKEDPFKLTPDPAYFYPSSTHNEGLLLLDYSIEQKEGFTTVIGEPGSGKTTLLNVFLEKWKAKAEIAIVLTPRLSPEEFLASILDDLDIGPRRKNKNEIIKAFRDFMIEKSSAGRWVVIIVDEAQNLPDETLEELRLLSNLETDKDKLLQIVLLGQPELETKLMSEKLRQLDQRITTRIHLGHFNHNETLDYINYRVIKAGKQNLQIDKKAGALAYKISKGVPRLINMLVSRALMAAYLEESSVVLPRHIQHAMKSLDHSEMKNQKFGLIPVSAGIVSALLIMGSAYFYFQHDSQNALKEQLKTTETNLVRKPADSDVYNREAKHEKRTTPLNPPLSRGESGGSFPEPPQRNTEDSSLQKMSEPIIVSSEQTQTPPYKLVFVKVDVANVREKPALDSETVGQLLKSAQRAVLQEYVDDSNLKWYQVSFHGEKRWIAEEVVEVVDLEKMNGEPETAN